MADLTYCTQTDLEIALGGALVLVQLADPNNTGTADEDVVTDYLESGAAIVRASVNKKFTPESIENLDAASRRLLRDCNKWLSAQIAWLEGGRGEAVPQRVADQAERVREMVDRISTGELTLAVVSGGTQPALSQPIGVMSYDPLGCGISIAGFKRGFR
jgi:phage gp36-like protein